MNPDLGVEQPGRGFWRRILRRGAPVDSPQRREATVVAFASGKGGTGKSFLTTNVAIGLHQRGLKVCVVDCDFGLANAHLLFGTNPQYSMQHLLNGQQPVQDVLTSTPHGPMLIAGGSGIASLAELEAKHMQMLARALHWVAGCHDIVLIDCAAGLAPQSMITLLAAHHVIMVTNPEIAALTDAYAVIKCLARQVNQPTVSLVVNRVAQLEHGVATFDRLAEVSRRFAGLEIHYLGEVPEDPAVSHRRLGQLPLVLGLPQCDTSNAIQRLVGNLMQRIEGMPTPSVEGRMLAQIRRW